ncbi:hypothetical protein NQ042_07715 [Corynebacterium phoceense]|uniref:hypothetical protein n=1 Tax=Corynebacterium phoceense TaxID=1686286 RepID=UPI001D8B6825|nr:hypothetical protein [Corynebacterium phoceense]MCQ9333974.1 hypothetical protein [Corynebacterium phoceense]HJG42864.1 hypothetical protein [Corynebacterium phoceense]
MGDHHSSAAPQECQSRPIHCVADIQVFIVIHNTDFARTLADLAREVEAEPRFITFSRDGSRAAALASISVQSANGEPMWS